MRYAFIISILFFVSCSNKKTEKAQETTTSETIIRFTPTQIKNARITLGRAEMRSISTEIKLTGKIDVPPQNMVSISFPLGGYLKQTKLLPGMHVNKGSVIAVLEDQQFIQIQQDYLTAKARQSFLENEYIRQRELNSSKASSDRAFQQADADYRSNKILIRSLYEKLRLIGINPDRLEERNISRSVNVYSPIDGFVSKVNVNIGKYVSPSEVLFELVNPTDIHLNLTVFEKDVARLSIGQRVWAYTNAYPDKKYPCDIILIGKDISANGSVEVHCHFDQYDKTLIPGMFMNAVVTLDNQSVPALPESAVVSFEDKNYVFVSRGNNSFEMKEVITGARENGYVMVNIPQENIASYPVVTNNAYTLLMALKNQSEE